MKGGKGQTGEERGRGRRGAIVSAYAVKGLGLEVRG